jgi:hypothetical protein
VVKTFVRLALMADLDAVKHARFLRGQRQRRG